MMRIRAFRPVSLLAAAAAMTAVGVGVPAAAQAAPAAPAAAASSASALNCELWRSTGSGLTGFARCTEVNGYPKFRIKVTCAKGATVYGPIVRVGQTTWASCTSAQGYVKTSTILGNN